MKLYVSGPISGHHDGNLPAFRAAARYLNRIGYETVVPHDCTPNVHDGPCPRGYARPHVGIHSEHDSTACFVRGDLRELLTCDGIFLLRGWEYSVGARAEFELAAISGLAVYYQHADVPDVLIDSNVL